MKKIIGIILIGLFLVGVGFAIAKIAGRAGGQIEKDVTFSVIVSAIGDYSIAMTPVNEQGEAELIIPKGGTGIFEITLTPSDGFDAGVELSVSGLPEGSFEFTRNPVSPGAWTTTLTIRTTFVDPAGNPASLETNRVYVCSLAARDI